MTNLDHLRSWTIKRHEAPAAHRALAGAWRDGALTLPAPHAVVLSTCERFEIYALDPASESPRLARAATRRCAEDAVAHLFHVAAGLDSRLIGESQIQAQLRAAVDVAHAHHRLTPTLTRLFRSALTAGAQARADAGLQRLASSYAREAARRIRRLDGPIGIVGTGALARDVAQELQEHSRDLVIFGRHPSRTDALAAGFGAEPAPLSSLADLASALAALIACVAAPAPVVRLTHVSDCAALEIIDLGVPHAVSQDVVRLPGVRLQRLEDLAPDHAPLKDSIARAESIVSHELERFLLHTSHDPPPPRAWVPRAGTPHVRAKQGAAS